MPSIRRTAAGAPSGTCSFSTTPVSAKLYDYRRDPNEMRNKAAFPGYADTLAALQAKAQAACTPVPPGFAW